MVSWNAKINPFIENILYFVFGHQAPDKFDVLRIHYKLFYIFYSKMYILTF